MASCDIRSTPSCSGSRYHLRHSWAISCGHSAKSVLVCLALSQCAFNTTSRCANKAIREGNDGPWSTFPMQVGTPNTEETRVLVSTAIPCQWAVLAEACNDQSCATSRGNNLFNPNASATWQQDKIYDLQFEENLNYTGNGLYGFDTVGLGFPNQGVVMKNQTVAGIVQPDFWMGYIGINPQATNFSDLESPIPSFFQNLYSEGMIPSFTYSYTAGAPYRTFIAKMGEAFAN